MARLPANVNDPTNTVPYMAFWDAADDDLSSVDTDQAPVELSIPPLTQFLRLSVASDGATSSPIWHIILTEWRIHPDTSSLEDPWVKAYISWTTQSIASSRRTHGDGANGFYIHNPINAPSVLDLRGMWGASQNQKWYLAVNDMGTEAANLYLLGYTPFSSIPS